MFLPVWRAGSHRPWAMRGKPRTRQLLPAPRREKRNALQWGHGRRVCVLASVGRRIGAVWSTRRDATARVHGSARSPARWGCSKGLGIRVGLPWSRSAVPSVSLGARPHSVPSEQAANDARAKRRPSSGAVAAAGGGDPHVAGLAYLLLRRGTPPNSPQQGWGASQIVVDSPCWVKTTFLQKAVRSRS
jgi:hypothetical protein